MPKLDLANLLGLLPIVGPVIAATREFKALYDVGVAALHPTDQAHAKDGYAALMARNDATFDRLDKKLGDAE